MNPRTFIQFFKTPAGRLLVFALVATGVALLYLRIRNSGKQVDIDHVGSGDAGGDVAQVIETVTRPMDVFRPPPPKRDPVPGTSLVVTNPLDLAQALARTSGPVTAISLFADLAVGRPMKRVRSEIYAPYGRLIPAETVITVDSSSIQTPIVGLITEDVYHAGKLVVPAGTEVHGSAQVDRKRERIASGNSWRLVWQTGHELPLRAIALDREFENSTNQLGWGITDGSAGLRGRLIKSDDLAEIKLFAATFLAGAAGALTEKEPTILGPIDSRSLNNAPLKGAQNVLADYAQSIRETIARDGFYVRVPSGKQFYLYTLQTLEIPSWDDSGQETVEIGDSPESIARSDAP
jgi:hypothetical protein